MKTNQQQSLITHCPQCQTYFKLFPEQLNAADGMVRCGTCTAIFNAKDSLVTVQPTPSHKHTQPHGTLQSQAANQHTEQTSTAKITLEDIEKNLFADFQKAQSSDPAQHIDSQELSINAFLRSISTPPSPLLKSLPAAKNSHDASQIQKLQPTIEPKNLTEPKKSSIEPKSPAEEINFNLWNLDLSQPPKIQVTSTAIIPAASTTAPTESTTAPAMSVATIIATPSTTTVTTTKKILQTESKYISETEHQSEPSPSLAIEENGTPKSKSAKNQKKPLSALKNLLAEPIDAQESKHHHSVFQLKWLFILLLSLLLLAIQHLYFNFSTLALDQNYRPWYEKACNFLGCQLPDQKDIRLMKAQKLVVRTHPEKEHFLMVDAIIINTAPYAQAFPNIQLSFSDIQNTQTISEVFPPETWKNDALKQLDKMPSNTPIQITLEMKDPGTQVPNYQIYFLE